MRRERHSRHRPRLKPAPQGQANGAGPGRLASDFLWRPDCNDRIACYIACSRLPAPVRRS